MLSSCTIPSSLLLSLRAPEWIDRQFLGFLSKMQFYMTFLPEFCTSGFSNTYLRTQWIFWKEKNSLWGFSVTSSFFQCAPHWEAMLYILFYRRRSTLDDSEPRAAQGQGQMQQQMVPVQDSYMQNRAEALQNVESTIVELSNIFSQLATMVAQQGEMAIRSDNLKFKACHFFFPGIQPVHRSTHLLFKDTLVLEFYTSSYGWKHFVCCTVFTFGFKFSRVRDSFGFWNWVGIHYLRLGSTNFETLAAGVKIPEKVCA